jgi:hypothetical protein
MAWVRLCDMSLGLLLCRCRTRRRWLTARWRSSRDVPCRWTGSGEGRTWGLDWGTRRRGDQLRWLTSRTTTSASVHESDRVDRVKTVDVWVKRGSRGLGGRPVKDGGETCRVAGDAYGVCYLRGNLVVWASKPYVPNFTGLGIKSRVEVPRRNGWHVAASRSSCRGEAILRRTQWPSDKDYLGLDHNALRLSGSTQNI